MKKIYKEILNYEQTQKVQKLSFKLLQFIKKLNIKNTKNKNCGYYMNASKENTFDYIKKYINFWGLKNGTQILGDLKTSRNFF